MSTRLHEIEVEIRYLTTEEGGRRTGVFSGYRGQFYYGGNDYDGVQFFPDLSDDQMVELGTTIRAYVRFLQERWDEVHSKHITVGMPFEIREGNRTVGRGRVTKV
ncbi:Elongation factor Tu [Planctopirus ephydatiae]|uniref:Elongation factor Tu n=1 Tax=Planctopirus ephydatiae TaxID=2528019 RepID=A0A518GKH9_9PLAN|nr:Elongation factor Tu [Planctopirus ephydatiae]